MSSNLNVTASVGLQVFDNTTNTVVVNRAISIQFAGSAFEEFLYLVASTSSQVFPYLMTEVTPLSLFYIRNLDASAVLTITLNPNVQFQIPPLGMVLFSIPGGNGYTEYLEISYQSTVNSSLLECGFGG